MATYGFLKEIVSLHVGQGGIQLGQAVWELLSLEHGIQADGRLEKEIIDCSFSTFFEETAAHQHVPRAVFVDLEPNVIDELRTGSYRDMYHPNQLINGKEDAANNFARGYYTAGKSILPIVCDETRNLIEQCESLQGIFVFHSMGGGSGSGFNAQLEEFLGSNYAKITHIDYPIYPSPEISTSVVEPYNALLSLHYGMDYSDICFIMDNESMYEICCTKLDIERPIYSHLNRIVCQVCSALTASLRFEGGLASDITQLQTNLIPYPRIHFPVINYAPIMNFEKANRSQLTVKQITREVFHPLNCFVKCDPAEGKYMSCCLMYRGEISPPEVQTAIGYIKGNEAIRFVNWSPTGFKVGINSMPATTVVGSALAPTRRNVTMLTNTSAIADAFDRLLIKFDMLYEKRAFIHWYVGEGMEECEFEEAIANIDALIQDYDEACESDYGDEGEFDDMVGGFTSSQREIIDDSELQDFTTVGGAAAVGGKKKGANKAKPAVVASGGETAEEDEVYETYELDDLECYEGDDFDELF